VVGFYRGLNPRDRPGRPNLVEHSDQLERAGVDHEIVVYPGAPHSFFDRKQEEFAAASTDAWTRTLDFLAAEPVEA
jgi:carboxymethylenebutenolidase